MARLRALASYGWRSWPSVREGQRGGATDTTTVRRRGEQGPRWSGKATLQCGAACGDD
jgi:hypothetical protein